MNLCFLIMRQNWTDPIRELSQNLCLLIQHKLLQLHLRRCLMFKLIPLHWCHLTSFLILLLCPILLIIMEDSVVIDHSVVIEVVDLVVGSKCNAKSVSKQVMMSIYTIIDIPLCFLHLCPHLWASQLQVPHLLGINELTLASFSLLQLRTSGFLLRLWLSYS